MKNIFTQSQALAAGIRLEDLTKWTGFDLVLDFYRLQNAGELALPDIPAARLKEYSFFTSQLQQAKTAANQNPENWAQWTLPQYSLHQFAALFQIIHGFLQGPPNGDFMLNIHTGEITSLHKAVAH